MRAHGERIQKRLGALSLSEMLERRPVKLIVFGINKTKWRDYMELSLSVDKVEFIYDQMDTNAINFIHNNEYLSIQTAVYLEEKESLNKPYVEMNSQDQSGYVDIKTVSVYNDKIRFVFEKPFLGKYTMIEVVTSVKREVVDFVCNYLYLGKWISYDEKFDKANIVLQTRERLPLDDIP